MAIKSYSVYSVICSSDNVWALIKEGDKAWKRSAVEDSDSYLSLHAALQGADTEDSEISNHFGASSSGHLSGSEPYKQSQIHRSSQQLLEASHQSDEASEYQWTRQSG